MSLIEKIKTLENKQKIYYFAFLVGFAVVLNLGETIIPKPLPFLRIGLAKISLLIVVYSFNFWYAILFPLLRVIASNIITGTILTPLFIWSLAGSMGSAIIMFFITHTFLNRYFSIYGVSILGAFTNNIIQWSLIAVLFHFYYYTMLPVIFILSIITGGIVGYIANYLSQQYEKYME